MHAPTSMLTQASEFRKPASSPRQISCKQLGVVDRKGLTLMKVRQVGMLQAITTPASSCERKNSSNRS